MISLFLIGHVIGASAKSTAGKVPFKKLGHHIFVKAKIDDSENDYNFIIDTGGLTFIDKTVAQELDLKQRGPMAKISTLNLSGFQIENIFCFTTFDFALLRQFGTPIHGIIGSNLMERFKVTFDFEACSVVFSTDTTSLNSPDNGLFFTFRNHPVNYAPIIKFKINQKMIEGMIDTGQPYPVVLPFKDFEQYEQSDISYFIRSKSLMIKWPQTNPSYNYLARLKSCEFADLTITNALCLFGELPPMLSMPLIGTDFLSQFIVIINYPKDELMLIPNRDYQVMSNPFSTGVNLNISENNEIFVEGIWEHSPADQFNIQVGDQVLAFNSKTVTPDNLIELIEILNDDHVKSIRLEIKNQNEIRKLKLSKEMLFNDLPDGFVYIKDIIPNIVLEMRYCTNDNFVGQRIDGYAAPKGILTKEAAIALSKVQDELNAFGLGIKVYDAYRPEQAVDHFVRWAADLEDTTMKAEYYPSVDKKNLFRDGYIAERSSHSRGSTVDLTIVSLDSNIPVELDMGSTFDYFGPVSWPGNLTVLPSQRAHRLLLQMIMTKYGFKPLNEEWWHFTLKNEPFPNQYFDFEVQ